MKRIMRRAPLNHLNGSPVPSYISLPALHHFIQNYKTNPNEVYLISYPKSGEHLLQRAIIELIRHHSKEQTHPLYSQSETIPLKEHYISQNNAGAVDERNESLKDTFNFWWTHNPHSLFPANKDTLHPNTKYIVINRHPKDVFASFCNDLDDPVMSANDIVSRFTSGSTGVNNYGCYYQWTLDWFTAYHNQIFNHSNQMLWIYYEDLACNPYDTIKIIKDFLYQNADDIITENDFNNIVELTSLGAEEEEHSMEYVNEEISDLLDETMWMKWAKTGT
eukprot:131001_1